MEDGRRERRPAWRRALRFGRFEYFAWRGKAEALRALLDHAVSHFYPSASADVAEDRLRTARRRDRAPHHSAVAGGGLYHGVMNTDNRA